MTRLVIWVGAALLAVGAVYTGAYWTYRSAKLKTIEPRNLQATIEWRGSKDAHCTLLLVGDSRIARWPLVVPQGWRAGRLGFPGEAAVNIRPAVRRQLADVRANVVVIQAGGNDATASVFRRGEARAETVSRAAQAVIAIGEDARNAGAQQVIVLTLVPPIEPVFWKRVLMGTAQGEQMTKLGAAIATEAHARGMTILDADALFRDRDGKLKPEFRQDSLHWSAAAYHALNTVLWNLASGCGNK